MSTRHTQRRTVICAVVCALLASALTTVAPAGANERTRTAGALAQQRYYASFGESGAIDRQAAAEAQGRYYASYGDPRPLPVPRSSEPSDDTPWLPITIAVAVAIAVIAAGSTAARRLVLRRPTRVAA